MTRRDVLSTAGIAAAVTAAPLAVLADGAKHRIPPAPKTGPSMNQLIDLAENGPDRQYYGRLLGEALAVTGRIANDNGDGTISLYDAENGPHGHGLLAEADRPGSVRPIPAMVLPHIEPANRGEEFPAGLPFEPLR